MKTAHLYKAHKNAAGAMGAKFELIIADGPSIQQAVGRYWLDSKRNARSVAASINAQPWNF